MATCKSDTRDASQLIQEEEDCTVVVGRAAAGVVAARRLEAPATMLARRRAARVARVHLAVVPRVPSRAVAFISGDNMRERSARILIKKTH